NNIFVGPAGLAEYDRAAQPVQLAGNVFLKDAVASRHEKSPLVRADLDPVIELTRDQDRVSLGLTFDPAWREAQKRSLVTSALLGRALVPDLPYEQPDGSPYRIDRDYFGQPR